jgi:hypothetical protein
LVATWICPYHRRPIYITSETRDDFEIFIGAIFDVNNPIACDEVNKTAASQNRLSDYNTSVTTPVSDDTQPNPKLLFKDDDDDLSPTVYSDDDYGYGPFPNNLDTQERTPYPAAANATILGHNEPVTTALSTDI